MILALLISSSQAFAPLQSNRLASSCLHQTPSGGKEEKALREELIKRNTDLQDEAKYGVIDGANIEGAFTEDATWTPIQDTSTLQAKMDQMVQPRPYPLFLLEKAAEFVESAVYDATSFLRPKASDADSVQQKERMVVLGTGWGAHSLLKGIDTDLYDVTVISPRNFFLFTPMLAGASVGTVEYRSITEPIREVCPSASNDVM